MYDSFNNFSFTTNFSNYKSLDLAIEKINDNYNKKNSRIDAIKVEAVLEKINRERLIEFTNISKETGRIKILNNTIFENSFKI